MSKLPQDVEEFIAAHLREDPVTIDQFIDVDDFRAWMTGHVRVPVEPVVTSAMKAECMGEFSFTIDDVCGDCIDIGADEDCDVCGGEIEYSREVDVPWDTVKEIFKRMYTSMLNASKGE